MICHIFNCNAILFLEENTMTSRTRVLLFVLGLFVACGRDQPTTWWETLYSSNQPLTLRVGYTAGTKPYFDPIDGVNPWIILEYNLRGMFPGRPYNIPKSLDETYYLGNPEKKLFSHADIRELALKMPGNPGDLKIILVDGNSSDLKAVSAYNTVDHELIAIFKPNNVYVPGISLTWDILTEQCTLVHEFGHSIGLVNNGAPMTSPHEQQDDRYHDVNPNCIMHTFGGLNPITWVTWREQRDVTGGLLFDDACIADVRAAQSK